jgi:hypothetical protein
MINLLLFKTIQNPPNLPSFKACNVYAFISKAGEGKVGTDESQFIEIFSIRSFGHLKLIFEQYQKVKWKFLIFLMRASIFYPCDSAHI